MAEAAAILAAAALALIIAGFMVNQRGIRRSVDTLRTDLAELGTRADVTADEFRAAIARTNAQLDRLADHAGLPDIDVQPPRPPRVPAVLRTGPVIKALAFGTGTAQAARRLRNGNGKAH